VPPHWVTKVRRVTKMRAVSPIAQEEHFRTVIKERKEERRLLSFYLKLQPAYPPSSAANSKISLLHFVIVLRIGLQVICFQSSCIHCSNSPPLLSKCLAAVSRYMRRHSGLSKTFRRDWMLCLKSFLCFFRLGRK